jgi:hypothetical protein
MSDEKTFPKRHEKWLPSGFQEAVESMDIEEIKSKIYECQAHSYEIDKAKDADEKLQQAKELVKELSAPYSDAQKTETAKAKYCFFVLEGRGVNITPD